MIPKNRLEKTRGNQTHIHITGKSREFFYDEAILKSGTSKDDEVEVQVSMANIKSLNKLDMTSCNSLDLFKDFYTRLFYIVYSFIRKIILLQVILIQLP